MKKISLTSIWQELSGHKYFQKVFTFVVTSLIIGLFVIPLIFCAAYGAYSIGTHLIERNWLEVPLSIGLFFLFSMFSFLALFMLWGGYLYITANGGSQRCKSAEITVINSLRSWLLALILTVSSFAVHSVAIYLIGPTWRKVGLSIAVFLILSSMVLQIVFTLLPSRYSRRSPSLIWLGKAKEDEENENNKDIWNEQFIYLLKRILPKKLQEEWLGDLREYHSQLIKSGASRWKVFSATLIGGLGLMWSYLWFKWKELISSWMNQANRIFRK